MNILFIHNNHPGQFKYLVPALKNEGHQIIFLSSYRGTPNKEIKQLWARNPTEDPKKATQHFRLSLEKLSKNYSFDLIISHSGFCCGTYAKYYFHKAYLISYLEWWFTNNLAQRITTTPFVEYKESSIAKFYLRNSQISLELSEADVIVLFLKTQAIAI